MTPQVLSREDLLARIRGEYREMPGLRLTPAQAQRLFALDSLTCEHLLSELVAAGFLGRTRDGAFVLMQSTA